MCLLMQVSPSSRGRGLKYPQTYPPAISKLSPSSRGRGLKWKVPLHRSRSSQSPSSRGRGLKYSCNSRCTTGQRVALFTRAWIEICSIGSNDIAYLVALFTRAWIEIRNRRSIHGVDRRRPLHEGVD